MIDDNGMCHSFFNILKNTKTFVYHWRKKERKIYFGFGTTWGWMIAEFVFCMSHWHKDQRCKSSMLLNNWEAVQWNAKSAQFTQQKSAWAVSWTCQWTITLLTINHFLLQNWVNLYISIQCGIYINGNILQNVPLKLYL